MTKGCRLIQDFILPALRNEIFGENLKWDPNDKCVFMLKWIHKARSSWSQKDAAVFLAWDKIKRRPEPKTHLDFVNSKQRLRAALRNVKTVQEVRPFKGYRRYMITAMGNLFQKSHKQKLKAEPDDKTFDIKPKVKMEVDEPPLQFIIKVKEENIKKEIKEDYENIERENNLINVKEENIKEEYENIEIKNNPIKVKEENTEKEIKEEYEYIETKNKIYSLRDRSAKRILYYQSESEEEFDITSKTMPNEDKLLSNIKKESKDIKEEIQEDNVVPENNSAVNENEGFNEVVSASNRKKDDTKSLVRFEKARRLSKTETKKIFIEDLPERKVLKRSIKKKRSKGVKSHNLSHRNAHFSSVFQKNSSAFNNANQINAESLTQKERAIPMSSLVPRGKTISLNRENFKQKSGWNNFVLLDQVFNPLNSKKVINSAVKFDKNRVMPLNNGEIIGEQLDTLETGGCSEMEIWDAREWPVVTSEMKDLPLNNGGIIGEQLNTLETGASSEMEVRDAREWPAVTPETALPVSEDKPASKGDNESAIVADRNEAESAAPETGECFQEKLWYGVKWPPESLSKDDLAMQEDNEAEREEPYPNFFDPETELTALLEYAFNTFLHPMTEKDIEDYKKYLAPFNDENWETLVSNPPPAWELPVDTQIPENVENELNSILTKMNKINADEYLNMDFHLAKLETIYLG